MGLTALLHLLGEWELLYIPIKSNMKNENIAYNLTHHTSMPTSKDRSVHL